MAIIIMRVKKYCKRKEMFHDAEKTEKGNFPSGSGAEPGGRGKAAERNHRYCAGESDQDGELCEGAVG